MSTLHQAARSGNLTLLRQVLDDGADIDCYDDSGHTPLMAACLSASAGLETVRFLLDRGADLHACVREKPVRIPEMDDSLDLSHLDPETRAMVEQSQQALAVSRRMLSEFPPNEKPVIALAVAESSVEKIRLLIERGADVRFRSSAGYSPMINACSRGRSDIIDLLLAAGAPVDGESCYGESALGVLSHRGLFGDVAKLLAHGANPAPLAWSPLMRAVVLGTLPEVQTLLDQGADLETADRWGRTPFLLAIHAGDVEKAALLLARGASRHATGRCGHPPLSYAVERDDTRMLQWLIGQGFDINQADEFSQTPLMLATEESALGCFRMLLDAGADLSLRDRVGEGLMSKASHRDIIEALYARGGDLGELEAKVRRDFIGIGTAETLPVSREEFRAGRSRRFGTANPEHMRVPFWNAMVRCGWPAYFGAKHFGDEECSVCCLDGKRDPVWCHDRFGMSLTRLPDGRFIQIAGEHEDHYDPDFCIYNDVFIHDGKGGFEILGYPEDVFPPTDFHSATLVAPWIYIIGNLGYLDHRGRETPVFRLHTETGGIERVATRGTSPGWIHRHRATLVNGRIRVSGGKLFTTTADGNSDLVDNPAPGELDLATLTWQPCAP